MRYKLNSLDTQDTSRCLYSVSRSFSLCLRGGHTQSVECYPFSSKPSLWLWLWRVCWILSTCSAKGPSSLWAGLGLPCITVTSVPPPASPDNHRLLSAFIYPLFCYFYFIDHSYNYFKYAFLIVKNNHPHTHGLYDNFQECSKVERIIQGLHVLLPASSSL